MNNPTMNSDSTHGTDGLAALLQRAVDDEPPSEFSADQQVMRGRRARRGRSALTTVSAAATVTVVSLIAVGVRGLEGGVTDPAAGVPSGASVAVSTPAATSRSAASSGLTKDNVAATIENELGTTFRTVTVRERMRMPSGQPALSLYGAIADPAGDTVFIFGMAGRERQPSTPPTHERTGLTLPSCNGSDFTVGSRPPESAYVGQCHSRTLSNGAVVIWRTGRAPGGYARSAAMLGRPDGSGVFAESTNQATVDPSTCVENATGKHCPVGAIVRPDTGVTAEALGELLIAMEPLTR